MQKITIASRQSALAMWQAEYIRDRLQKTWPHLTIEILGISTKGDRILDRSLAKIGGKGLFIKELEHALLDGHADLAVHSLKDVPMQLPPEFTLAAITERANPFDAFVANRYDTLKDLPAGAVVGTSSLRREAQIRARFPNLVVKPLRGNVQTRLQKLDDGLYDAIILAASGLMRLGLKDRIRTFLSADESLPAAGQGALGIEIAKNRDDLKALLAPLHHATTAACVIAERELSHQLGGSCQVPLAAYAQLSADVLTLNALVASVDGSIILHAGGQAPLGDAKSLGQTVANDLIQQGALALIDEVLKKQRQIP